MPAECENASSQNLVTKDLIIITEYEVRRKTNISICGPSFSLTGTLGCLSGLIWADILYFLLRPELRMEIWNYDSPNPLDVDGKKMKVILTGRKLSGSMMRVVISTLPAQRIRPLDFWLPLTKIPRLAVSVISIRPVMGMGAIWTGMLKPPVWSISLHPFPAARLPKRKMENYWWFIRPKRSSRIRDICP